MSLRPLLTLALFLAGSLGAALAPDAIEGLIHTGQLEEAAAALDTLASEEADHPDLAYLRARLLVARGDPSAGVDALRGLLAASPQQARLHAALGTSLVQLAETLPFMERPAVFMEVIECYEQAVGLDPELFEGRMGLAQYYLHAPAFAGGSLVKAEEHARVAARLLPELGRPVLVEILRRRVAAEPDNATARAALAELEPPAAE
jgi:thioredoxin-like negative regulator of GroEL